VTEIVVDASVALAWCFRDEATDGTRRLLEELQTGAAVVPVLWHLEVANVLGLAERRHRITAADSAQLIDLISALEILIDEEAPGRAFAQVLDLARSERLTAYDATYLELAMRIGLPLATKDNDLGAAAQRLGIELVDVN